MSDQNNKVVFKLPFTYQGNIVWPILFIFLYFPVAILLVLLNTKYKQGFNYYSLKYHGSFFWLVFWTIVFFPVAFLLGLFNGFDVIESDQ